MEFGNEMFASLRISVQTTNMAEFNAMLVSSGLDLEEICDFEGHNIFHELFSTREDYALEFLSILHKHIRLTCTNSTQKLANLLNAPTKNLGLTPLHLAVQHNRMKTIQELLKLGANPHILTKAKQNVLHLASLQGNCMIFSYFWQVYDISLDDPDATGRFPLHLAAQKANENVALMIIAHSSLLDVPDQQKMTPLHYAAYSGNYRISKHLILNGASRKIQDLRGSTPLRVAELKGFTHLFKLLVKVT